MEFIYEYVHDCMNINLYIWRNSIGNLAVTGTGNVAIVCYLLFNVK